jgi:DNA helicase-2/ATP-dependent DNA helicase PcrA
VTQPRGTVQGVTTDGRAGERTRLERELLAGCDHEQAEAITTPASPLCVLAGAGSGKTRVLTRRIAWRVMCGSATATHVLALTFTRKAALELRSRLGALGLPEAVTAGTFHSVALAELKRLSAEQGRRPPVVMSSKVRMLMDVLDDSPTAARTTTGRRRPGPAPGGRGEKRSVADLASEIEWAKSRCLRPDALVRAAAFAGRRSSWDHAEVAEIWERYEVHKRRRGVLDFEDLLARCTDQLLSDHEFAASARWRYRHLFVDEYQDVNEAQQRLLRAWLAGNDDLCVVGDPHQAIYSWNGANPKAITNFGEDFPGATVLRLSVNYRSTHEVLTVAGAVLGETKAAPAGGVRPEGPIPTVVSYTDETAEAAGVAEGARSAKRPGRSWSQIAVLARTNAQLNALEAALCARGVPCHVASAAGLLGKPWVQEAVRVAARSADTPALAAWAADLLPTAQHPDDDEATAQNDGLADDARLDLTALGRLAGEYLSEDAAASGAGFQSWLQAAQGRDHDPIRRDAVSLTTFHRAKGLEWAVVFVTGLEDGYVPISHARDPDSLAEERRLLYVACTRAEEELHCSWAAERSFPSSRPIPRAPSPWLSAIEAAHRDLQRLRKAAPEAAREALAASRRVLEGA